MIQRSKKIRHNSKLIRYAIGWGLAALIDLFFLWFFTDLIGVYYLTSQVFAFIISFTFGFYFQKYLTFRDYSGKQVKQAGIFLVFQLLGLGINLLILKGLVEHFGLHYLIWSVIAKWVVFVWNFVMNHYFNFSGKQWK